MAYALLTACGGAKDVLPTEHALSPLNDTGITGCSSPEGSSLQCPQTQYPGQDAETGRDAQALLNKQGGGNAGFDFTKLDRLGLELEIQDQNWSDSGTESEGTSWSCVRDNVTGLVWEIKRAEKSSVQYFGHKYTWFNPSIANGGNPGTEEGGQCQGIDACNTEAYANYVNSEIALCGSRQWRLPTVDELLSIIDQSQVAPPLDTHYFPNASADAHWSSQTAAHEPDYAWYVYFTAGGNSRLAKFAGGHIILVNDQIDIQQP